MSSIEKAIDRLSKERSRSAVSDTVSRGNESPNLQSNIVKETISEGPVNKATDNRLHQPIEDSIVIDQLPIEKKKTAVNEAVVDLDALSKAGYLTPNCNNKVLFEEYRIIKRPILMNAFGKGAVRIERGNLIAVTSSLPGEGKTYNTFNLGISIASELDSTVLLVDGDVLHGSLSKMFGLEKRKGLTDVLADPDLHIADVLTNTPIPKLKVIPAGTRHAHSTELYASDTMDTLVAELSARYDDRIILFDLPPILATSEASVLNHLMGQLLIVVEAGQTPVNAVKDTLNHVDKDKVVGMVLNKSRTHIRNNGYGSYYGSYY